MSDYLTRAELLQALTGTHEKDLTPRLFGGRRVRIRELTARQRLMANEAATAESPDAPDQALYRAMLVQMAVVDPATGDAADPRTRAPLLTLADVQSLADGRDLLLAELVEEIAALAALPPRYLFRGDPPADGEQRDADAGDASRADAAARDADARAGDAHGGAGLSAEPGGPVGDVGAVE